MENIKSTAELIEAIQIMEAEQANNLQQVKEKFYYTRQSFRPVNIISSSLKGMVTSPNLFKNILGTGIAFLAVFLSGKAILVGASNNKSRRIFGNVIKLGLTSFIARNPNAVNSVKQFIARGLHRIREKNNLRK